MNKIYRLRFDRRRNALVVVSEITTGAGKEKNTGHVARLPGPSSFVRLMGTLTPLALLTGFIISLFPGGGGCGRPADRRADCGRTGEHQHVRQPDDDSSADAEHGHELAQL